MSLPDRTEEIAALHAEIFGQSEAVTTSAVNGVGKKAKAAEKGRDKVFVQQTRPESDLTDDELLGLMKQAKNGAAIDQLLKGDISGYPSPSEADLALCNHLAFWTGNDTERMDRLFRQSGLYREKWERKYSDGSTYGQRTIVLAISNTTDTYEPRQPAGNAGVNGHGGPVPAIVKQQEQSIPSLPESARIDPELGRDACPWLDDYVGFSQRMSPRGYEGFHEAIGLWLLSTVAARRLMLQLGTKVFYPNLYITLCAHTTLYAKTTTARVAQDIIHEAGLSYLLLPNDMTPQAFINELVPNLRPGYGEMSRQQQQWERWRLAFAGQRGWFYEEFGTKIRAMMKDSGFMADFRGLLRVFDDNQLRYQYVTMQRRDAVEWPYLALLANMTPADIRPYAKPGFALWQDGFWARWVFITPPVNHPPSYGRFPDRPENFPTALIEPLQNWHKELGVPVVSIEEVENEDGLPTGRFDVQREEMQPKSCTLANDVLDAFYAYLNGLVKLALEQADRGNTDLIGNYGRFPEKALRVAMLLAGISNGNHIELFHWARAQTITEGWRADLHALADQVSMPGQSEERQIQEKIIDIVGRHGPSTAAEIGRNIRNVSGPEVNDFCRRLVKSGDLQIKETTKKNTNRYGLP